MAKSVLDIIIRTIKEGGADKETVTGLTNIKSSMATAAAAAAMFTAAYYTVDKAIEATVGKFVDYAAQVREMSRVTGMGAEDASRLIQSADDMAISYESLQKALWFASKNGMDVSVDSMAKLADQYVSLGSASEKAEFLTKNFGKAGAEMGKYLEQGGSGVRAANAAIEGNLVLTEKAVKAARDYEIATDNLKDSVDGLMMAMGQSAVGPLTQEVQGATTYIKLFNDGMDDATIGTYKYAQVQKNIVTAALEKQKQDVANSTQQFQMYSEAVRDAADNTSELSAATQEVDYGGLLDSTFAIQDGMQGFADKAAEIQSRIAELDPASADYATTLSGLEGELRANAAAQEVWAKKLVFSMVQARLAVGGIDSGEFAFLIELGVQMGLVDDKSAAMAQNLNDHMNSIDLSKPQEFEGLWNDILDLPDEKNFRVVAEGVFTGFPDGFWNGFICFTGETKILLADGNYREIKDLRVGDEVKSYDVDKSIFVNAKVEKIFVHESVGTLSINDIQTTPSHPFLVNGTWKKAGEISIGDVLMGEDGQAVTVEKVSATIRDVTVYNIETDHETHNYFAGGVLVHNKSKMAVSSDLGGGGQSMAGVQAGFGNNSTSNVTNSGTTINVYNPTFTVTSGKGIVDVLEALT